MTSARISTLATLRRHVERIETGIDARIDAGIDALGSASAQQGRVALGHGECDAALSGGLAVGTVHEVFAEAGRQSAAATGFVAGLSARVAARRPLLWVRQDFSEREAGSLSMSGLCELGLDPRCLVSVRAPDADSALRTAADALACDALGAVVLEIWGEVRRLDLVASRKLTLAAQASGVTALLLRLAAAPQPSTAETRWIVRAAHSPPAAHWQPPTAHAWGTPVFDAHLVRNRHGQTGRWIMEWKCDERLFNEPAANSQPVAAAAPHRPHQAKARIGERRRRAG